CALTTTSTGSPRRRAISSLNSRHSSRTSTAIEAGRPAVVHPVRYRVQHADALLDGLRHLRRRLDRWHALREGFHLLPPRRAPVTDQLGRHLDVALQREVRPQRERLIAAVGARKHPRCASWYGKSLAVPVKRLE